MSWNWTSMKQPVSNVFLSLIFINHVFQFSLSFIKTENLRLWPSAASGSSKPPWTGPTSNRAAAVGQMKCDCFGRRLTSYSSSTSSMTSAFGLNAGSIASLSGCSVSSCSLLVATHWVQTGGNIDTTGQTILIEKRKKEKSHIKVLRTRICWVCDWQLWKFDCSPQSCQMQFITQSESLVRDIYRAHHYMYINIYYIHHCPTKYVNTKLFVSVWQHSVETLTSFKLHHQERVSNRFKTSQRACGSEFLCSKTSLYHLYQFMGLCKIAGVFVSNIVKPKSSTGSSVRASSNRYVWHFTVNLPRSCGCFRFLRLPLFWNLPQVQLNAVTDQMTTVTFGDQWL